MAEEKIPKGVTKDKDKPEKIKKEKEMPEGLKNFFKILIIAIIIFCAVVTVLIVHDLTCLSKCASDAGPEDPCRVNCSYNNFIFK